MRPSVVLITASGRPHEVFLLGMSVPLGVGMLLTAPAPQSVLALMPRWFVLVWAATLALSGLAGVVSLHWRWHPVLALQVEGGALIANGGALALFAAAAVVANGWRAWFAAGFFAAWAAANVVRSFQIGRAVRRTLRDLDVEREP